MMLVQPGDLALEDPDQLPVRRGELTAYAPERR